MRQPLDHATGDAHRSFLRGLGEEVSNFSNTISSNSSKGVPFFSSLVRNTAPGHRVILSPSRVRAQNGGNRGQSNHRSASAFAYGCPRPFTDRENHLPKARTVRTKTPPRRAEVCIDVVCI